MCCGHSPTRLLPGRPVMLAVQQPQSGSQPLPSQPTAKLGSSFSGTGAEPLAPPPPCPSTSKLQRLLGSRHQLLGLQLFHLSDWDLQEQRGGFTEQNEGVQAMLSELTGNSDEETGVTTIWGSAKSELPEEDSTRVSLELVCRPLRLGPCPRSCPSANSGSAQPDAGIYSRPPDDQLALLLGRRCLPKAKREFGLSKRKAF
ncbi:hypothetical protein MG293_016848 [Ovis ammon polii]|uniref:Uncharacterized protein n=1 Tax=Ovis ammon polii TaxID=230172 RepID=A0AAD4Y3N8_OVIAM|nr:hypothetical protein MG293_016848 [Ovis ammon polii]